MARIPSINSSFVLTSGYLRFRRTALLGEVAFGNVVGAETSETEDMVFSRALICLLLLNVCTALGFAQFPNANQMVRWRTIASGSSSTETRQKLQLASERTELENLWGPVLKQNRTQPLVDYSKDRVVVIFLGTKNSGGYSAQVKEVVGGGGSTATVYVNELYPGRNQKVTQEQTSPWVMIAIDRSYLDIQAKIDRVENNQPTSYQLNPLTTISFLPWNPCGYGYGGTWNDPCGYGFDSPYAFQNWCQQNRIDYPNFGQIDFNQSQLVFLSAGDFGLGWGIQVGDIFSRGGETVIQVRRGNTRLEANQRGFTLVSLSKGTGRFSVEYLVSGDDCYLDGGAYLPVRSANAWIVSSSKDLDRIGGGYSDWSKSISGFDYSKGNLGLVCLGELPPHMIVAVDRVAYRGSVAYVYIKKSMKIAGLASSTSPYFAFQFDRKIRGIKVVDLSQP